MSTNKTQNYQLHSWLPEDEFHLTEINENFTALDTALKNEAQTAANGRTSLNTALSGQIGQLNTTLSGQISQLNTALQSEITTRTQQIAGKADKTEVAKKTSFLFGSYVGKGPKDSVRLELGIRAKAIIVIGIKSSQSVIDYLAMGAPGYSFYDSFTFDNTGVTIDYADTNNFYLVDPYGTYYYIALY